MYVSEDYCCQTHVTYIKSYPYFHNIEIFSHFDEIHDKKGKPDIWIQLILI